MVGSAAVDLCVLARSKKTHFGDDGLGDDEEQMTHEYTASELTNGVFCPYYARN